MQHDDLVSLVRRLLWGTLATRRDLAEELAHASRGPARAMLANTARSDDSWQLRARCLEVLGLAAGQAQREVADEILRLLLSGHSSA
jgi:hypothetical protein